MLKGIHKSLTGDMLKVLCDMGHGDVLVIADANFPGESIAKNTSYGKLLRCPGIGASELYNAICDLFPLDVSYLDKPANVMEVTDSDKAKGMQSPEIWEEFRTITRKNYPKLELGTLERFAFYEEAKKAYAVIETGEERLYGNLLLVKGCIE